MLTYESCTWLSVMFSTDNSTSNDKHDGLYPSSDDSDPGRKFEFIKSTFYSSINLVQTFLRSPTVISHWMIRCVNDLPLKRSYLMLSQIQLLAVSCEPTF